MDSISYIRRSKILLTCIINELGNLYLKKHHHENFIFVKINNYTALFSGLFALIWSTLTIMASLILRLNFFYFSSVIFVVKTNCDFWS